jgi:hypothetical protein
MSPKRQTARSSRAAFPVLPGGKSAAFVPHSTRSTAAALLASAVGRLPSGGGRPRGILARGRSVERARILSLQRAAETAQRNGDIGKATELGQLKLDAVRRLHGVAS